MQTTKEQKEFALALNLYEIKLIQNRLLEDVVSLDATQAKHYRKLLIKIDYALHYNEKLDQRVVDALEQSETLFN